ncbi:MAG: BolA family transcriptional regulator [Nitrospinae bacterium]|nr:BolA family transcriptional regulator [Nitrospinota bacterium]MBL7019107.1 BolA family transcriptional regulator [Nitrospinaceae bacterium]
MDTTEIINVNLKDKLSAEYVEILDESHKHRGHKAAGGGGHYSIIVVSPQFENLNVMDRVRLVHKALDQEMTGTPKLIHALQVKTFDTAQWNEKG